VSPVSFSPEESLPAEQDGSLERALERTEGDAASALKAATDVARELKRLRAAARDGVTRDLQKSIDAAVRLVDALRDSVAVTREGWVFDEREHLASGAYQRELVAAADRANLRLIEHDGRLLTYPSVVRVLPSDAAIEIDRKREKRIRPSVVVRKLQALRDRPVRFHAEQFLESLFRAYELLVARAKRDAGTDIRLIDVHDVLTLLPGQSREYSREEFARDLYLLEESGVDRTRDGLRVGFPAATGTKGRGSLATVSRDGRVRSYYAVSFRP
jgi:hypothetical protein